MCKNATARTEWMNAWPRRRWSLRIRQSLSRAIACSTRARRLRCHRGSSRNPRRSRCRAAGIRAVTRSQGTPLPASSRALAPGFEPRAIPAVEPATAAGLPPQSVIPRGQRKSRADGKPLQAFRKDHLSARYRAGRAAQAADSASAAQARRDHARRVAGAHVLRHGFRATVEDCNLSAWARLWGRALFAFSPGTLLDAIRGEAIAVAKQAGVHGGIRRASTNTTALSQHCLCGRRVAKSLGERVHSCPGCGLTGDRDAVSATLAAYVVFADPDEPSSAVVKFERSRASLGDSTRKILRDTLDFAARGRQDAPSESTAHSAPDGSSVGKTGRAPHRQVVARRRVGGAAHSTPDETGASQTTPERVRTRPNMSQAGGPKAPPLRDSS